MNWVMDLRFNFTFSSFSVSITQIITYTIRSCRCFSDCFADGTYGKPNCAWAHLVQGSCRPKGAALTQTFKTYRFPFLTKGMISPVSSQISAPAHLPKRPSYPMSAQRLRLSRPL